MKNNLAFLSIITFSLVSCKNEAENTTPKVVVPFYQVANLQQNQALSTPQPNNGQSLYPTASAQNATGQTQSAPLAVAKGTNPSHGQPGHRCDIPVGAPLTTATNNNNTNTTVASNTSITVPNPSTVQTPKGMNPPHGQPGHRCDISVGAPLNSKAVATTPAPQAPSGGTLNYNVTVPPAPENTTQTSGATPTAEGMNPPHGQDGHRCDVAVGAPLPK